MNTKRKSITSLSVAIDMYSEKFIAVLPNKAGNAYSTPIITRFLMVCPFSRRSAAQKSDKSAIAVDNGHCADTVFPHKHSRIAERACRIDKMITGDRPHNGLNAGRAPSL